MSSAVDAIPDDEMSQYRQFMQVFSQGEVILVEGKSDDDSLFLLREGTVGVYRRLGDENKLVANIDAINIFGEMALIMDAPRSASVVAQSDEVVVYKIQRQNLKSILANPTWSDSLISRLVNDLKSADDQIIKMGEANLLLEAKNEKLASGAGLILAAHHELIQYLSSAGMESHKTWRFFFEFEAMTQKYLRAEAPDVGEKMADLDKKALLALQSQNYLPEVLKTINSKK